MRAERRDTVSFNHSVLWSVGLDWWVDDLLKKTCPNATWHFPQFWRGCVIWHDSGCCAQSGLILLCAASMLWHVQELFAVGSITALCIKMQVAALFS